MLNLCIDEGIQEINLNGKVSVWLNLSDLNFIERFFDAFEQMDKLNEKYRSELDIKGNGELFAIARQMDKDMKALIDRAFGSEISAPLFGDMNVYAIASGLPIWCNLMLAIIDEMNDNMTAQKKATNPKLQKYIEKYQHK